MDQPHAQFVAGENHHTHLAEIFIAARVVSVYMGIDEKANWGIGNLSDCRNDFLSEGSALIIHKENPVRAHQRANGSALTLEGVEIAADFSGLDLNLAEIGLRRCGGLRATGLATGTLGIHG